MKSKILKILVFMLTVALMCASFAFVASAETEEVTTPTTGTHQFTIVAADGTEKTAVEGTLNDAIMAVTDATDVIRLDADAQLGNSDMVKTRSLGNTVYVKGTSVQIDLNGKTLSFATTSEHFFQFTSGGGKGISITNGTIDAAGCAGAVFYSNYASDSGALSLTNLTVNNAQELSQLRGSFVVTVDSCDFVASVAEYVFYQRVYDLEGIDYRITNSSFDVPTTKTGQYVIYFVNWGLAANEPVTVNLYLQNIEVSAPNAEFVYSKDQGTYGGVTYDGRFNLNVTYDNITVPEGVDAFNNYGRFNGSVDVTATGVGENAPTFGYSSSGAEYFPKGWDATTTLVAARKLKTDLILCRDITETTAKSSSKSFTLNLSGHTLTVNLSSAASHWLGSGNGTYVFKNGNLVKGTGKNIQNQTDAAGTSSFTFQNMNVTWTSMFDLRGASNTVVIEDSVITGSLNSTRLVGTNNFTIKNSTMTGGLTFNDYSSGDAVQNITIENSTIGTAFSTQVSTAGGTNTVNIVLIGDNTLPATLLSNKSSAATVNLTTANFECTGSPATLTSDLDLKTLITVFPSIKLLGDYAQPTSSDKPTPVDGLVLDLNGFELTISGEVHFMYLGNGIALTIKNGTVNVTGTGDLISSGTVYDATINLTDLVINNFKETAFDLRLKSGVVNVSNVSFVGDQTVFSFRLQGSYYNEETGKYQVSSTVTTEIVPLVVVNWNGGNISTLLDDVEGVINVADYAAHDFEFEINFNGVSINANRGDLVRFRQATEAGTNTASVDFTDCNVTKSDSLVCVADGVYVATLTATNTTALTAQNIVVGEGVTIDENADITFLPGSVGSVWLANFKYKEAANAEFLQNEETGAFTYYVFIKSSANLTLYSDFDYNIIVYVRDGYVLNSVTIDGVAYDFVPTTGATVQLENYTTYVVTYENIAPASANASFEVAYNVTLADGETTTDLTQTHSIAKYAQKLLAGVETNADYAAAEQLIVDMLAYIKAAYTYVGAECADIDVALGENAASIFDAANNAETSLAETGITSAALELGNVPAIRFYLANAESVVTITYTDVFGNVQTVTPEAVVDGERIYVTLEMRVYNLTKVLTVNVDGVEGTYDVYDYATSEALPEADKALVEALVAYAETAEAYRTPVQEETPEEAA